MNASPPPEPVRYGRLAAVLALSILLGFALGVYFYRRWAYDQRNLVDLGLNMDVSGSAGAPQAPAPVSGDQPPAPSSLTMIRTGPMGSAMAGHPGPDPEQGLTSAIRNNEPRYANLAWAYTRKYPVIQEYGRDWASYPDLHRFNLEYNRDHNPVKFSYDVASSKNFAALVKKYAERPEMLQFIQDAVKIAPSELTQAARNFLSQDSHAYDLLRRFASAAGLPDSLVAGLTARAATPNQAASALKTDPKLKEFLRRGNINADQLNQDLKGRQ